MFNSLLPSWFHCTGVLSSVILPGPIICKPKTVLELLCPQQDQAKQLVDQQSFSQISLQLTERRGMVEVHIAPDPVQYFVICFLIE
jgi:hypothetical protein